MDVTGPGSQRFGLVVRLHHHVLAQSAKRLGQALGEVPVAPAGRHPSRGHCSGYHPPQGSRVGPGASGPHQTRSVPVNYLVPATAVRVDGALECLE